MRHAPCGLIHKPHGEERVNTMSDYSIYIADLAAYNNRILHGV